MLSFLKKNEQIFNSKMFFRSNGFQIISKICKAKKIELETNLKNWEPLVFKGML